MELLIVCYLLGLLYGVLEVFEWLVSRVARLLLGVPAKRRRMVR